MQVLSATLEAAQRELTQSPRVRLLVRDKMHRWSLVGGAGTELDVLSAACVTDDGVIVVATLDASGDVRVRRVTDAETRGVGEGWGAYPADFTLVVSGVLPKPYGDVAISNNGGTLRLFYVRSDGQAILAKESTDGGVTWPTSVTVKMFTDGGTGTTYRLASGGNDDLFWWRDVYGAGTMYYRVSFIRKTAGSWSTSYYVTNLGQWRYCGGLSAVWRAATSKWYVAAAFWTVGLGQGRIVTCTYTVADGGQDVQAIVPPGMAAVGFTPLWPSLIYTESTCEAQWLLTYIDKFSSGNNSWAYPIEIWSRDFVHWSYKVPLPVTVGYENRLALVGPVAHKFYAHHVQDVIGIRPGWSGHSDKEMFEEQGRILRYKMSTGPGWGALTVELDNRDGRYDSPGTAGVVAAAMKPLAQVIMENGHKTGAGDESKESICYYLWSVNYERSEGRNWAKVIAYDGFEVMRRWRPDATYSWKGKTLRWLIEEIAMRVGGWVVKFDDSDKWDLTVDLAFGGEATDWWGSGWVRGVGRWVPYSERVVQFTERMTGEAILNELLNLVGGVARWGWYGNGDYLYCQVLGFQPPFSSADYTYDEGEIIAGEYVDGFIWPTRVRATGVRPDTTSVAFESADVDAGPALGMELFNLLYSANWRSTAACTTAALSMLDDAYAREYGGWIKTRPNLGLELWDTVEVSDSLAGGGNLTEMVRRVHGIVTEYDPYKGVWAQVVELEGV